LGLREALFNALLGFFFGTPSATATLISLGGFGAQAVVALCGVLLMPFFNFLGPTSEQEVKNKLNVVVGILPRIG
jgi:hypothetical protein